jgi:3-oxoacyl-[acyl-carrier protein] reductase
MTTGLPRGKITELIPMGRLGRPDEVAKTIRFLCSDDASYITGQVISVNGGMY